VKYRYIVTDENTCKVVGIFDSNKEAKEFKKSKLNKGPLDKLLQKWREAEVVISKNGLSEFFNTKLWTDINELGDKVDDQSSYIVIKVPHFENIGEALT
jgi:hypothetical protein